MGVGTCLNKLRRTTTSGISLDSWKRQPAKRRGFFTGAQMEQLSTVARRVAHLAGAFFSSIKPIRIRDFFAVMQKNFRLDSLDSRLVPVLHRADLHTRTHNPQVQSETAWNRQSHLLHYPRTNAVRRRPSQRSRCPRRTRAHLPFPALRGVVSATAATD